MSQNHLAGQHVRHIIKNRIFIFQRYMFSKKHAFFQYLDAADCSTARLTFNNHGVFREWIFAFSNLEREERYGKQRMWLLSPTFIESLLLSISSVVAASGQGTTILNIRNKNTNQFKHVSAAQSSSYTIHFSCTISIARKSRGAKDHQLFSYSYAL